MKRPSAVRYRSDLRRPTGAAITIYGGEIAMNGTRDGLVRAAFAVAVLSVVGAAASLVPASGAMAAAPALAITTSTLPPATIGQPYSASLSASGGTGAYSWRLTFGLPLPRGLSLSSSGVVSGTPTADSRTSTVIAQVQDSTPRRPESDAARLTLLVLPPTQTVSTGGYTGWTVYGGGHVWALSAGAGVVTEVQPTTGSVLATYNVAYSPNGILYANGDLWVTFNYANTVEELSAATGALLRTVSTGTSPEDMAFDGTHVWVVNQGSNNVTEIAASTGAVVGTVQVGAAPWAITYDGSSVWVADSGSNQVSKINVRTGTVVGTYPVGINPEGITSDGLFVWVTNRGSNSVSELLSTSGRTLNTFATGGQPIGIAFDGSDLWIANDGSGTVSVLSDNPLRDLAPAGTPIATVPGFYIPSSLAFDGSNVWVGDWGAGTITKL